MEDNAVFFSIVTPSYNQGRFLAETIESVISQEGDFSIDYLIVDGGSTDDSVAIIRRYDALVKQGAWPVKCRGITLHWVSEKDRGQTDALMKGFRMAKGNLFAWLNSDDSYLPGALQAAAAFFQDYPDTGLMYGDALYRDLRGSVIGQYHTETFALERLAAANIICQPAAFFMKNAFEAVGGLDRTLDFVMDLDLWARIGKRFPCRYRPGELATYRLHEASKTISTATLYNNCEEALAVVIRHFGWAPLTRVYTSCRTLCTLRLPNPLGKHRLFCTAAATACSIMRSLYLNRGIHCNDLRLLNRENFRKLFKSRVEIMTGRHDSLSGEP